MYGINNKRNGVVFMYVTTCVNHKPEVCIDLLTSMQIDHFRILTAGLDLTLNGG